jgi:beta-N-acetylhexosaminidase
MNRQYLFKAAVDVIFGLKSAEGQLPLRSAMIDHEKDIVAVNRHDRDQVARIAKLWAATLPKWSITLVRLNRQLDQEHGIYLLHPHGFCLAYVHNGAAKLAAIGVELEYRNKGLATALIKRIHKRVQKVGNMTSWSLGSVFPRFWAGLPFEIDTTYGEFFKNRGKFTNSISRCLLILRRLQEVQRANLTRSLPRYITGCSNT